MEKILETKELILRKLTREDFNAWHEILSDEETMQFYPSSFTIEKTKSWIENNLNRYEQYGFGLWAVVLKDNNQFIGDCGITMQNIHGDLKPEIGFHINKKFWNQGYATQAAGACLQYAFERFDFKSVFCYQKYTNVASRKVAEAIGMTFMEEYPDEINEKTSVYGITREEFEHREKKK